jgi:RimJ/RimL family protein N-acetyltransferase
LSDEIEVVLYLGLTGTPALELAIRGWAEMQEKGHGDGTINVHSFLNAFVGYAPNGRESLPVSVATFSYDPDLKRVWLFQAYTLPEFRGRGVYNAVWKKLVEHSIVDLKAQSIQLGTNVRNTAMRAVGKKQGMSEEGIILRYDLP